MFKRFLDWVVLDVFGGINWEWLKGLFHNGRYYDLSPGEQETLRGMLRQNYFFILTRRKTHFSTYTVGLAHFLLKGKWGYWSHSLVNLENDPAHSGFKLVEAVSEGVKYSSFDEVFDVDSVALLIPAGFTADKWTQLVDKFLEEVVPLQVGKRYDSLFDFGDDQRLSCVELITMVIKSIPDYHILFPNFLCELRMKGKVTPQSMYDCGDFVVYCEIRH